MNARAWAKRLGAVLSWGASAGVLGLGACIPLAGAGYLFDLVSNLAAQALGLGVVVCSWFVCRRRWGRLAAAGAGCGLMAWPLVGRSWILSAGEPMSMTPVRILVFNSSTTEGDARAAMGLIESLDADVVVLTEPSGDLLDLIRASPVVAGRYPGYFLPGRADSGYSLVLSRWPQSPVLGDAARDVAPSVFRLMRIERPGGPFLLVALHPHSPRSAADWVRGNEVLEEVVVLLENDLLGRGPPVVVAADLNSTPSGWRSRRLVSAGVRRAKPLMAGGTYPSGWPWPFRVAIDDVWMSQGCAAVGRRTPGGGGSDHLPVLVEAAIPGQAGAPAGR